MDLVVHLQVTMFATVKSSLIEWEFKTGSVLQYVTLISGQDMTPLLV